MTNKTPHIPLSELSHLLKKLSQQLGFAHVGISHLDLSVAEQRLQTWLAQGFQGDMDWMARHGTKRTRAAELVEGTLSIISLRMDYLPPEGLAPEDALNHPELGYISRYALGRDYHKVLRQRLEKFAQALQASIGTFGYRVFTDSAPVMEKPIAVQAGLGWMGKHTNVLSRESGSWFFLGEIYTDLPLMSHTAMTEHCGHCTACIDVCPTHAIVAPYVLDARRCISYLTIEYKGSIPLELRPLIGNRIYGCDDCQLICPWNRFAKTSTEADFAIRQQLDQPYLVALLAWTETQFNDRLAGSAIRRIGFERWQRNIAVALGNAPRLARIRHALRQAHQNSASELVKEHLEWAIKRHEDNNN